VFLRGEETLAPKRIAISRRRVSAACDVLDTSVVIAFMNRRDDDHERVASWMDTAGEELLTTPLVVAEIDHLVSRVGGADAARAFYEDLRSGAYLVEWWPEALAETVEIAKEHGNIGLAEASLIALAARFETLRVATLDERHFRAARPLTGEAAFTLLPADA
jgi:predicted nucleic acid-binding protein